MNILLARRGWTRLAFALFILAFAVGAFIWFMTGMPGKSFSSALPPLSPDEARISADLKQNVNHLAVTIGERNIDKYEGLGVSSRFIEEFFNSLGYSVQSQEYQVGNRKVRNLIAELPGGSKANEIVVVGAHYDSVDSDNTPGADDNASGVAGLLELAQLLKEARPARTIRFVAFVNEEPPWFQTRNMGSLVYARAARERHDNIVAALSLETVGMYSDVPGSQQYPEPMGLLYPDKGNFIGFVGNLSSRSLVRKAIGSFRKNTSFPSEGSAAPAWLPGVGWSDHWSFWQVGYPAIMITDTAPFRNPNYHRRTDTPDTLDYDRMARVVHGLAAIVTDLGK